MTLRLILPVDDKREIDIQKKTLLAGKEIVKILDLFNEIELSIVFYSRFVTFMNKQKYVLPLSFINDAKSVYSFNFKYKINGKY